VRDSHPTIIKTKVGSVRAAHELLSGTARDYGYVLDAKRHFIGVVSSESLRAAIEANAKDNPIPIDQAFLKDVKPVTMNASMQDILPEVASRACPVPVVDENSIYKGVVSKNRFLKTLHRTEEQMEEELEQE
jgi:glycine betaine/proline transport system ATP-binding protein